MMYNHKITFIFLFVGIIMLPGLVFALIPPDWTVIDNEGNGVVWTTIAGSGESANYTGGTGDCASVSSDQSPSAEFDTELRTPIIDLGAWPTVYLDFLANYQNFANLDFFDVDVSINGGIDWTNVLSWNEDHGAFRSTPGVTVSLNISSHVGGITNVMIRFRYYDPNTGDWAWYAQIDDFHLHDGIGNTIMRETFDSTPPPTTYTMIYNGNGNTDGTAPVDPASPYEAGSMVTVLDKGNLVRSGYTFNNWNRAANGSGTSYAPGATFAMPESNVVLYAQWSSVSQPIPTLSEWGMIIFSLMLAGSAIWMMRRRQVS